MLRLENRVQLYVKFVTRFIIGAVGIPVLLTIVTCNKEVGVGIGLFIIFILSHLLLAFQLIGGSILKRLLLSVFIIIVSASLITFKMRVNARIIDPHLNFTGPTEFEQNLNYIGYFVWTTIVLWEIVFYANNLIKEKLKRIKVSR
jgi:hypothetical protein